MAQTHIIPGSKWSSEEENAVFYGYVDGKGLDWIVENFPTDRNPESIRMKFANHVWEKTNGKQGLRGGNKWVKQRWARNRANILPYHFDRIKELNADIAELEAKLMTARNTLAYHRRRVDEMVYFPN